MIHTENLRRTADFMKQASGVDPVWLRQAADEIDLLRGIVSRTAELPYFKNERVEALVRDAKDALLPTAQDVRGILAPGQGSG